MEKLIVVSVDSHAQPPPEVWPEYLETPYHDLLPELREEQELYFFVMKLVFDRTHTQYDVFDQDGVYQAGNWRGLYDLDLRLAEMDREGIAGEFVNNGDGRIIGIFFEAGNRVRSAEVCRAGVRAYHRWLYDTMGGHPDRLFLVGAGGSGPCGDLEPVLEELDWIAERGFRATAIPRKTVYPGDPALSDPSWEPFWARLRRARPRPVDPRWARDGTRFPVARGRERVRPVRRHRSRRRPVLGDPRHRCVPRRAARHGHAAPSHVAADVQRRLRPPPRARADDERGTW